MSTSRPPVKGIDLDAQTRCAHYRKAEDVIAIKMKCCDTYYACKDCHDILAGHPLQPWPRDEWNRPAILCGCCGTELTIAQYLECGTRCPICQAEFNPNCRRHYDFYFEMQQ